MNYEDALGIAQTNRLGTRLQAALVNGKKRLPMADIAVRQEEFAAGWDAACDYMESIAPPPENAYRLATTGVTGYYGGSETLAGVDVVKAVGNAYLDAGDAPVAGV